MKKVGNHNSISRILLLSLALMLTFSLTSNAQDAAAAATPTAAPVAAAAPAAGAGDPVKGKELFNTNCAACHKLDAKSTGPSLRGVADKHEKAWLVKWIHNSSEMIKAGDPAAVKLFNENNKSVMTAFPQLSEADIDAILAYTSQPKADPAVAAGGTTAPPGTDTNQGGISNNIVLAALSIVMLLLVVMLFMVNNVLTKVAKANGIEVAPKTKGTPIWKAFAQNQFLVLVSAIFLLLASGYFVYGFLMQVGVDQEYAPIQPIHYSHRIHAGSNGIDCKYCHSAARISKNAGIQTCALPISTQRHVFQKMQEFLR